MLAVDLAGGLGNQLFQVAAADTIARETNRIACTVNAVSPKTVRGETNYMDSVLSAWNTRPPLPTPYESATEPSCEKQDWTTTIPSGPVCLYGYFQNWKYIDDNVRSKICLPPCPPLEGAFLHIRGGDYVLHWLHDVDLNQQYYQRAVEQFPPGTHFYVFTDDIAHASQCPILKTISHTIMDSDDVTSLAQMAACTAGGICANSSFSWWGAYLNPHRTIVMPDRWFNVDEFHIDGYYFPGVIKCPVGSKMSRRTTALDIYQFIRDLNPAVLVEIGVHFGEDTRRFRTMLPNARLVGFEADPRNIAIVRDTGIDQLCEFYPVALSNASGVQTFYMSSGKAAHGPDQQHLDNDWSSSSSLKRPTGHLDAHKWVTFPTTAQVPCMRLDHVESLATTIVDFVWAEVQGAEDLVFAGAREVLSRTRYVYTEYATDMYEGQLTREQLLSLFGPTWQLVHDFGGNILLKHLSI